MAPRLLVLGCGFTGSEVARQARAAGDCVLAVVRRAEHAKALRAQGLDARVEPTFGAGLAELADPETDVIVAYQADEGTDAQVAPALARARSIAYVSSTGVYGETRGVVTDHTPLAEPMSERAARLFQAEQHYRRLGATVLRSPGIYGAERGVHRRILRGEQRIPGDGSHVLSRIHVVDLAQLLLAARLVRGETFVVGDREPASHLAVARFVCDAYGLPFPPFVPLAEVHESLRADRRIDGSRALEVLGVSLRYPTFREGMAPAAASASIPS